MPESFSIFHVSTKMLLHSFKMRRLILSHVTEAPSCWVSAGASKQANKQTDRQTNKQARTATRRTHDEVGPTVRAPAVLPLSVSQSADAGFQSLLLQHAGGRAGRVEIQHLPGTHGQHVHAVEHGDGASFSRSCALRIKKSPA